jgi:hypothetical protein
MVRPSLKSTVSVSSVTTTFVAAGTAISISEEVIPSLQERFAMVGGNLLDTPDFSAPKSAAVRKAEWIQPDLRHAVLRLYVYVRRVRRDHSHRRKTDTKPALEQ